MGRVGYQLFQHVMQNMNILIHVKVAKDQFLASLGHCLRECQIFKHPGHGCYHSRNVFSRHEQAGAFVLHYFAGSAYVRRHNRQPRSKGLHDYIGKPFVVAGEEHQIGRL